MRKKTLVWLTSLGSIFVVVYVVAMLMVDVNNGNGLVVLLSFPLFLAGWVMLVVAWIGMMVVQAKQGQWGWFVCNLIFGWFTMVLYLMIVPEMSEPIRPTYMPPYQPISPYQPYQQPMSPYQPYPPMERNPSEERW